jgi:hypothetical protein
MAEARVESIDAIKSFRAALVKFADEANVALADAESEVVRTMSWLENEQSVYWASEVRKRSELVARCKDAVRQKKIFKDSSGRQQSAIEEEKALKIAMRRLEEAEMKVVAVRKSIKRMEKEIPMYKGTVQRFSTDVIVALPAAAAHLENLIRSLEAYTSLAVPTEAVSTAPAGFNTATGTEQVQSMARAIDEAEAKSAEDEKRE